MKAGHSINRPVLARRLELDKRRRDYKIHLRTLKEQKCGTDFSHPPVVFRIQTVQKNSNAKRKERKKYEDKCIEKMNEHYANKVMNSKSFHDPYLIEQLNKNRGRKASPSSSQQVLPKSTSPSFQSTKSIKSNSSNPNKINENESDNTYNNYASKKTDRYNIPHYKLPPEILQMCIESEENRNKEQNAVQNKNFEFQFNEILANEPEKIEISANNDGNEGFFEIRPPDCEPRKVPSRSSNRTPELQNMKNNVEPQENNFEESFDAQPLENEIQQISSQMCNLMPNEGENQINNENIQDNDTKEETFDIHPPEGEPRKASSRSSNSQPTQTENQVNKEVVTNDETENFEENNKEVANDDIEDFDDFEDF